MPVQHKAKAWRRPLQVIKRIIHKAPSAASVPKAPKAAAPKAPVASPQAQAADWLQKRGPTKRQVEASKLAEKKYKPAAAAEAGAAAAKPPPAKRRRQEPAVDFSAEVLSKAPSSIQTCRSLLLFLEKKLGEKPPALPETLGPKALIPKLEAHAGLEGRITCAAEKSGWDARAKRILDISAVAASEEGQAVLTGARKTLDASAAGLSRDLKDQEEIKKIAGLAAGEEKIPELGTLIKDRIAWEKVKLRFCWLAWCTRLVQVRETKLLAEVDGKAVTPNGSGGDAPRIIGLADILQAILHGEGPPDGFALPSANRG